MMPQTLVSWLVLPFFSSDNLFQIGNKTAQSGIKPESLIILLTLGAFLVGFTIAGIVFYFYFNFLWKKKKNQYQTQFTKQIKRIQKDTAIRTAQSLASFFIQEISSHNNQIKFWLERKKNKKENLPQSIIQANHNISQSLTNLSRLSYEIPYLQDKQISKKN